MRKKKLTPELLLRKESLAIIANNVRVYKKSIIDYQKELAVTTDEERKIELHSLLKTVAELRTNVSKNFRHLHVAYCELRGTSRSRIEGKLNRAKPLDEKFMKELSRQFSPDFTNEEAAQYLNG